MKIFYSGALFLLFPIVSCAPQPGGGGLGFDSPPNASSGLLNQTGANLGNVMGRAEMAQLRTAVSKDTAKIREAIKKSEEAAEEFKSHFTDNSKLSEGQRRYQLVETKLEGLRESLAANIRLNGGKNYTAETQAAAESFRNEVNSFTKYCDSEIAADGGQRSILATLGALLSVFNQMAGIGQNYTAAKNEAMIAIMSEQLQLRPWNQL